MLPRFKGVGRCVTGWHLGFKLGRGAPEGTLQFAQGRVVSAVPVMFQKKRSAAKHADENLRRVVTLHTRTCFCSKPKPGVGEKLSCIAQIGGFILMAAQDVGWSSSLWADGGQSGHNPILDHFRLDGDKAGGFNSLRILYDCNAV